MGSDSNKPRANTTVSSQPVTSLQNAATSSSPTPTPSVITDSSNNSDNAEVLQQLKDALNAQILAQQQRVLTITNPSPPIPSSPSLSRPLNTNHVNRVDAIKEEYESNVLSILTSGSQSPSTADSTESIKTVKAFSTLNPATQSLKTPSYPFPSMSKTPLSQSPKRFRQSSTGSLNSDNSGSSVNTPIASAARFAPPLLMPTAESAFNENSLPAPNLYDIVMTLNLEPGLEAWWSNLANILSHQYGAERVTLSLPADAGEPENVPWGQKATFNLSGPPRILDNSQVSKSPAHIDLLSKRDKISGKHGSKSPILHSSAHHGALSDVTHSGRPQMMSRHSFAGYEREIQPNANANSSSSSLQRNTRPSPFRAQSHVQLMSNQSESTFSPSFTQTVLNGPERFRSLSDVDMVIDQEKNNFGAEIEDEDGIDDCDIPYSELFTSLRALDSEEEPLLEATGVNKIIRRGKAIILTREFSTHQTVSKTYRPKESRKPSSVNYGNDVPKIIKTTYEEYEQSPSSPWAQSPAPSPAVQNDSNDNPFFIESNSFSPPTEDHTYSQAPVKAIGVDKAHTLIHVPLVHPRNLSNFPFRPSKSSNSIHISRESSVSQGQLSPLKRTPLAILSICVPIVPYPPYLSQSLQLLAPHLATTYDVSQQFTHLQQQVTHRASRNRFYSYKTLSDLADADIEDSNSITSLSDYSGFSRPSPGDSIGTPGGIEQNPSSFNQSTIRTPGGVSTIELTDSYFDFKRNFAQNQQHSSQSSSQSASAVTQPSASGLSSTSHNILRSTESSRNLEKDKLTRTSSFKRHGDSKSKSRLKPKSHILLHSHGADFSSTFSTLPAPTTPAPQTPARPPEVEGISAYLESADLPPPSERLLRTIVDSLPVQIFTADPYRGDISWVNSKFLVYRGQKSQQIITEPMKAIHPSDRDGYLEEWQKSLKTGQQFSRKCRIKRFDASYRWFFIRATPLKDRTQRIVHWVGTCMDIHEQHIAEVNAARQQETAASEEKYRALANSSPQIVFAATRLRGVIFCNSQWIMYSGQTGDKALGFGFMDFVHPEDVVKCRLPTSEYGFDSLKGGLGSSSKDRSDEEEEEEEEEKEEEESADNCTVTSEVFTPSGTPQERKSSKEREIDNLLKVSRDEDGQPSFSAEVRLRNKEGQYRWHLVRVLLSAPNRNDEAEETWYGTCTDINDHKILEQTLKDTMDAKSRFLSNMSHEIRTPLNGILGMVNFLMDTVLSNEQMEHVNIIRNSTEGLRDLINDILDLSKVEAGMIHLSVSWMHVRSLIEEVNDIMFALAVDKGLELNYIVDSNVPGTVKGDRFRIRQILLNIVGNAIKFTEKGEVFVKCELLKDTGEAKENEVYLQFQIIDTGKGFNEKQAEYLFKRFSQIEGNSGTKTGTGLGLAISMQLVELHGGKMSATSKPGQGSNFTFSIKCQTPSVEDKPTITERVSLPGVEKTLAGVLPTPLPIVDGIRGNPLHRSQSDDLTRYMTVPTMKSATENIEGPISGSQLESERIVEKQFPPPPPLKHTISTESTASSIPSLHTTASSVKSERSSVSSAEFAFSPNLANQRDYAQQQQQQQQQLSATMESKKSNESVLTLKSGSGSVSGSGLGLGSKRFSILVVCPLKHSRQALIKHVESTIPKQFSHQISSDDYSSKDFKVDQSSLTHIIIDMPLIEDIKRVLDEVLTRSSSKDICTVVVTDLKQRRELAAITKMDDKKISFIFKPVKPSKMARIFDPGKTSEAAEQTDTNTSAQAAAVTQKMIFADLKTRFGEQGLRILLVEDNKTSQMVLSRFLGRAGIEVEVAVDGMEAVSKVFENRGKWDFVFCDLQMPIKDGYETCKEIREWEKSSEREHMPIIALSANVLGDVYEKCAEAGFNSYVTKPVEFGELRDVLIKYLDPPGGIGKRMLEFMKRRS